MEDIGGFIYASTLTTGAPLAPGSLETASLSGLPSCALRFFALKIKDAVGNWSAMETTEGATMCGGCCSMLAGGGVENEARTGGARGESSPIAETEASDPTASSVKSLALAKGFALERKEADRPTWRIRALSAEEARSFGADTVGALLVGTTAGDGTRSLVRLPNLEGPVGVATALRANGQIIGLGNVGIGHLLSTVRAGGGIVSVGSARHSKEGDRLAAVRDSGGRVNLSPGDTLEVAYGSDTSAVARGTTETHFLVIETAQALVSSLRSERTTQDLPLRFALRQNRPNPFAVATTFQFELPRAERVTLEVLDIQGRRIARVANGSFPAGYHSIRWEPRSSSGRAQPGVYLYRIVAGSFRDQKKLVVLP